MPNLLLALVGFNTMPHLKEDLPNGVLKIRILIVMNENGKKITANIIASTGDEIIKTIC